MVLGHAGVLLNDLPTSSYTHKTSGGDAEHHRKRGGSQLLRVLRDSRSSSYFRSSWALQQCSVCQVDVEIDPEGNMSP